MRMKERGIRLTYIFGYTATAVLVASFMPRTAGAVEVAAEGSDDSIAHLRGELSQGPDGCRVESVDELEPIVGALDRPFSIVR